MVECVFSLQKRKEREERGRGSGEADTHPVAGKAVWPVHRPATERLRQEDALSPGIPGHLVSKKTEQNPKSSTPEYQPMEKKPGYPAETLFAPLAPQASQKAAPARVVCWERFLGR